MGSWSPWSALLAMPAAILIGFAFAAVGMAATTFMRSWQDFEYVQLVLAPMFLFSATFYPLDLSGRAAVARAGDALYHGVALVRELMLGDVGAGVLAYVAYLAVMGLVGAVFAARRVERLLLT